MQRIHLPDYYQDLLVRAWSLRWHHLPRNQSRRQLFSCLVVHGSTSLHLRMVHSCDVLQLLIGPQPLAVTLNYYYSLHYRDSFMRWFVSYPNPSRLGFSSHKRLSQRDEHPISPTNRLLHHKRYAILVLPLSRWMSLLLVVPETFFYSSQAPKLLHSSTSTFNQFDSTSTIPLPCPRHWVQVPIHLGLLTAWRSDTTKTSFLRPLLFPPTHDLISERVSGVSYPHN